MDYSKIFNEEIFKPDFPLDGKHLIAASAGTGKTYNIQNIYARLIMEKSLRVSQIQVMTFTEAATKELKERLRTVLKDLQARFNGVDCDGKDDDDTKRRNERADRLIEASQAERAVKRNAVELALLEFDGAAISTIHGFCSRALSRYAFETQTPFITEIENNKDAELASRTKDWWRKRKEIAPAAILPELDFQTLLGYVKALSGKTDWTLAINDPNNPDGFMLEQAKTIVDGYENDRINRKTQTFDDLLRAMREALRGPFGKDFAAKLREEFKAALIDEFQDTDPVQYEVFQKVFIDDNNAPVFFVGDPKQAIYAFRGGDIFTYRAAAEAMTEEQQFYLDTNFRSTQRLMDAVNAIFKDNPPEETELTSPDDDSDDNVQRPLEIDNDKEELDEEQLPPDESVKYTFGDIEIAYPQDIKASAKPALKVDGKDDPQPFRFINVNITKEKNKTKKKKDTEDEKLYDVLAKEVVNTLNDSANKLTPKSLAILVRKKANAKKIMQKLREWNVPCTIQNPGNVFANRSSNYNNLKGEYDCKPTKIFNDFYNTLLACAKIGGKRQVITALATPFFGLTPAEILSMDENTVAEWIVKFNDINRIWLKRGFSAAMSKLQEYGIRNGIGYRERLASLDNGERLLADCGQIIELALAATKEIGPAPVKLIEWLEERITNAAEENDSDAYERELESENDAVRIMTMHVSKGLQFPVVFLPDCNKKPSKNDTYKKAVCYHDRGNGNQLTFSVSGCEVGAGANLVSIEEEQEELRLLYVAMTRAEQRTVALYSGNLSRPLEKLMENARRSIAKKNPPDPPIKWIGDSELPEPSHNYELNVQNNGLNAAATPAKFDLRHQKGSYSAISPSMSDDSAPDDGKDNDAQDGLSNDADTSSTKEKLPIFQIRGGANIGSCWHEILEKLPFNADDDSIKSLSNDVLAAYGFDPQSPVGDSSILDVTCGMIGKTLDMIIISPDGNPFTLRDIPLNERLSELEFNFPSAHALDNTERIAEIMRRHWQDDQSKAEFLLAVKDWKRAIPRGFMNGFIDLVFRHGGLYYIVDWKSNIIGGSGKTFTEEGVRHEMATHGYFFQYLLYAAVLQRYLKDLPGGGYSWEKNFGGIRYYFLRGIDAGMESAVFNDRPSETMLDEIGEVLGMEVKK